MAFVAARVSPILFVVGIGMNELETLARGRDLCTITTPLREDDVTGIAVPRDHLAIL